MFAIFFIANYSVSLSFLNGFLCFLLFLLVLNIKLATNKGLYRKFFFIIHQVACKCFIFNSFFFQHHVINQKLVFCAFFLHLFCSTGNKCRLLMCIHNLSGTTPANHCRIMMAYIWISLCPQFFLKKHVLLCLIQFGPRPYRTISFPCLVLYLIILPNLFSQ